MGHLWQSVFWKIESCSSLAMSSAWWNMTVICPTHCSAWPYSKVKKLHLVNLIFPSSYYQLLLGDTDSELPISLFCLRRKSIWFSSETYEAELWYRQMDLLGICGQHRSGQTAQPVLSANRQSLATLDCICI